MKLRVFFDNPLDRKKRIIRSFELPKSATKLVKELMVKSSNGNMIILPVEVVIDYDDNSTETTTIFISTLCEKHNRQINNFSKPQENTTVIVNKPGKNYIKKSLFQQFKSIFKRRE